MVGVEQFGTGTVDDTTGLDASADGAVAWSGCPFGSFEGVSAGGAEMMLGRLTHGR